MVDWEEIRELFPALNEFIYLNTASNGLLSKKAIDTGVKFLSVRKYGSMRWIEWYKTIDEELRNRIARLLNCDPSEVGFVPNTSTGINMIAHSIRWEKGMNIVTTDMEFPTNLYPWQVVARRYGLEIRYAQNINGIISMEEFETKVDDNTQAIIVSWVEFANGFTNDLKALSRLARKYGAYMIVDGIQGVGSIPLNLGEVEIDILICGMQKWLLGTGGGFIYINSKILDDLEVSFAGWLGDERPFDFSFRTFKPAKAAKRFELGTPSFFDLHIANTSLELILEIGIDNIHTRNRRLIKELREKLLEFKSIRICTPMDSPSSIFLIKIANHKRALEELRKQRIIVSHRAGGLRISPHFYNNYDDIDALVTILEGSS